MSGLTRRGPGCGLTGGARASARAACRVRDPARAGLPGCGVGPAPGSVPRRALRPGWARPGRRDGGRDSASKTRLACPAPRSRASGHAPHRDARGAWVRNGTTRLWLYTMSICYT